MTRPALRAPALSTPMVGIKFQHEFFMDQFTVAVCRPDWRLTVRIYHGCTVRILQGLISIAPTPFSFIKQFFLICSQYWYVYMCALVQM